MSHDIRIGDFSVNITSNMAPLFADHATIHTDSKDKKASFGDLTGMSGNEAFRLLRMFFDNLDRELYNGHRAGLIGLPIFCAKYDAQNGWGSTVGCLVDLARLMGACAQFPNEIINTEFSSSVFEGKKI